MIGLTNWHRWLLPGVLVTLVLTALSILSIAPAMERDLVARGERALAADGQDWAALSVRGRRATVSGTAPSAAAQSLAAQSVARSWGIAEVIDDSGLLPIVSPFVWTATLADETISLTGYLPAVETRTALHEAIRSVMPTVLVRDETKFARGSPDKFPAFLDFAVARLAELASGRIELNDAGVSVSGVASDMRAFTAANSALRENLPGGFNLVALDLAPPRAETFVWSATYEDKWITLGGMVTSEAARQDLIARAKGVIPGVQIADRMSLASGAPEALDSAIDYLLALLPYLSQGKVELAGADLMATGTASTVDNYEAILATLAGSTPDGFSVAAATITPAPVSPYVWHAEKTAAGTVIGGYAPSEEQRDEAVAAARAVMQPLPVTSGLRIASGAPRMDWTGAVKFAVGQLAKLKSGRVEMSDRAFTIAGEAASSQRYAELSETFERTLPASLQLARADLSPPVVSPYQLTAELAGDRLVLSGSVPAKDVRSEIVATAKDVFGGIEIIDGMGYAGGQPADLAAAVTAGLHGLGRVSEGKLTLTDRRVDIDGLALNAASIDTLAAAIRKSIPSGFQVDITILPPEPLGIVSPDECQQLLRSTLSRSGIQFAAGAAEILEESKRVLDRLAGQLQRCPASLIEIGGHTDSSGGPRQNKDLSADRAEAVLRYLASVGVLRERLTAVGYGEENPVASNRTEDGRARNRRIELNVITPLPTQSEPGSE